MTERKGRDWNIAPRCELAPDFDNILAVLNRGLPDRPTLFEFFLNGPLYERLARRPAPAPDDPLAERLQVIRAFHYAGYDYATVHIPGFAFTAGPSTQMATRSLNAGAVIADRASFEDYAWPDPNRADYGILDALRPHVPPGMKLIVPGPGGVLENVIQLVGFDRVCYLLIDDEPLLREIFDAVGSRLVTFYERVAAHELVGALIGNDDWGFKSQLMLSPDVLRRYVFPWHCRIVATIHRAGKPAILHSCGNLASIMDDVIDDIRYDAKHSFEDTIQPVEDAYEQYGKRIAILGGIDLDFVCRAAPEAVYDRSRKMLQRAHYRGGYALGTGNSVPAYTPDSGYYAMIAAALDRR